MDVTSLLNESSASTAGLDGARNTEPTPRTRPDTAVSPRTPSSLSPTRTDSRRVGHHSSYSVPFNESITSDAFLFNISLHHQPGDSSPTSPRKRSSRSESASWTKTLSWLDHPESHDSVCSIRSRPYTSVRSLRPPPIAHNEANSDTSKDETARNSQTPSSPLSITQGHKFSDSRSSLCSRRSAYSADRSSVSSVTTVNCEATSVAVPLSEARFFDNGTELEMASHSEAANMATSPTADDSSQRGAIASPRSRYTHDGHDRSPFPRPSSPSDTVLKIKSQSHYSPSSIASSPRGLATPETRTSESSSKLHKRTISAPNFPPSSSYYPPRARSSTFVLKQRQTPMVSSRPESASGVSTRQATETMPYSPIINTPRTTGPPAPVKEAMALLDEEEAPVAAATNTSESTAQNASGSLPSTSSIPKPELVLQCMFVEHCNTGSSQLRKAISHFFGRNKSCTKLIPKEVWIYFCRKHYQRCRYRNAKTYPDNQISYVITQIERIKDWDVANREAGSPTHIKHWQFALRKREKNRLQQEAPEPEEDDLDLGMSDITPAPKWVLDAVDAGNYSTDEILGFAQRFQSEIREGILGGIPEVEFLPLIEGAKPDPAVKTTTRKTQKQTRSLTAGSAGKRKAAESPELVLPSSNMGPDRPDSRGTRKRLRVAGFDPLARFDGQGASPFEGHGYTGFSGSGRMAQSDQSRAFPPFQVPETAPRYGGHGHSTAPFTPQGFQPQSSTNFGNGLGGQPRLPPTLPFQRGPNTMPILPPLNPHSYETPRGHSTQSFMPINSRPVHFGGSSSPRNDAQASYPPPDTAAHDESAYTFRSHAYEHGNFAAPQFGHGHNALPPLDGQNMSRFTFAAHPSRAFVPRLQHRHEAYVPPVHHAPVASMVEETKPRSDSGRWRHNSPGVGERRND